MKTLLYLLLLVSAVGCTNPNGAYQKRCSQRTAEPSWIVSAIDFWGTVDEIHYIFPQTNEPSIRLQNEGRIRYNSPFVSEDGKVCSCSFFRTMDGVEKIFVQIETISIIDGSRKVDHAVLENLSDLNPTISLGWRDGHHMEIQFVKRDKRLAEMICKIGVYVQNPNEKHIVPPPSIVKEKTIIIKVEPDEP